MPIYEYQCLSCGHRLEEIQKVSEPPLTECPVCGKPQLERLVSHTSFQLKGGGYYATDYKEKPKPKEEKTEVKAGEVKTGDAKTEAAPSAGEGAKDSKKESGGPAEDKSSK